jgi:hypothetical protein
MFVDLAMFIQVKCHICQKMQASLTHRYILHMSVHAKHIFNVQIVAWTQMSVL